MSLTETLVNSLRLGPHLTPDGAWEFLLWAPNFDSVSIHLSEGDQMVPMTPTTLGYHRAEIRGPKAGATYRYRLDDGRDLPDPTSRFQPEGVHGPSQLVDTGAFHWSDQDWKGIRLERSVIYEMHVGTYTREGTYEALIPHLPHLADLGITTVELMPLAQFPGSRNWGYDGVFLYAPQNSYGSPESLQHFVDAAHRQGLAVALDVVYNHLGPEGNYLGAYGPYFTDRYRTPWGEAINYDGEGSDEVRRFFIENALYWLEEYHFDALRLDAVHGIFDFGARHFLAELKSEAADLSARLGRQIHLIAESDMNDSRLLHDPDHGGYGLDSQWSDDFHHSVHTLLTQEDRGYYSAYGGIAPLVETLKNGWYYTGQYSTFRKRRHGNSAAGVAPAKFVVCSQNHDQVGNRAAGERLTDLVTFEELKLAAGITLLSPFVPMLFMGEEYGEPAPFQYFVSHGNPDLVEAVRRGRREEFAAFGWQVSVPDPQDEETFRRSTLDHSLKGQDPHKTLYRFYQELIRIRSELKLGSRAAHSVRQLGDSSLLLAYASESPQVAIIFSFAASPVTLKVPEIAGKWTTMLYSAAACWKGPGPDQLSPEDSSADKNLLLSPYSFLVLKRFQSLPEAE
jgi:maltooligosyltrehalose trehalohydrolase